MAGDALSDIVTMAGARCDISTSLVAGGPWALDYPPPRQIKFMAVVKGACWLRLDAEASPHRIERYRIETYRIETYRIETGDVLMLSGPRTYRLASDLSVPPRDGREVFADPTAKRVTIGDGDDFVAIGGHVVLDAERGWMLADVLPPVLHIDGGSTEASTMRFFLDQLVTEVASERPGAGLISEQLAQLLFVQALRSYLSNSTSLAPGWTRVLADERLAPALRLMHREPGRPWRIDELAKIVAMSRTNFAVRFKAAAGVPPLTYLSNWRMRLAEQTLRETATPIATLALSLGYASESAFSNAFKRATGAAPSRYRSGSKEVNGVS